MAVGYSTSWRNLCIVPFTYAKEHPDDTYDYWYEQTGGGDRPYLSTFGDWLSADDAGYLTALMRVFGKATRYDNKHFYGSSRVYWYVGLPQTVPIERYPDGTVKGWPTFTFSVWHDAAQVPHIVPDAVRFYYCPWGTQIPWDELGYIDTDGQLQERLERETELLRSLWHWTSSQVLVPCTERILFRDLCAVPSGEYYEVPMINTKYMPDPPYAQGMCAICEFERTPPPLRYDYCGLPHPPENSIVGCKYGWLDTEHYVIQVWISTMELRVGAKPKTKLEATPLNIGPAHTRSGRIAPQTQ